MEEYQSSDSGDKMDWIWSKVVNVGKKVLTVGVVVSTAPILIPSLVVLSAIALITSVPYCLYLANYACTQKLMSTLLPATPYGQESNGLEDRNGEDIAKVYEGEPLMAVYQMEEGEIDGDKETKNLIERIRDEGRTDQDKRISENEKSTPSGDAKSQKVELGGEGQGGKKEAPEIRHEGESGDKRTETLTDKEEASSNEPIDQAENAASGTGEEKRKNTVKKKRKTGRSGV